MRSVYPTASTRGVNSSFLPRPSLAARSTVFVDDTTGVMLNALRALPHCTVLRCCTADSPIPPILNAYARDAHRLFWDVAVCAQGFSTNSTVRLAKPCCVRLIAAWQILEKLPFDVVCVGDIVGSRPTSGHSSGVCPVTHSTVSVELSDPCPLTASGQGGPAHISRSNEEHVDDVLGPADC